MNTLIRLSEQDNVAVATTDIRKGTALEAGGEHFTAQDAIPFAHKIAVRRIEKDAQVFKYGVPIGRAKADIAPGEHVHVHNLRSDYVNNEVDFFEEDAAAGDAEGARA